METSYKDIEFALSYHSADEKILKDFLDRGLVEPNKTFREVNSGDTMLDNAIKYNKKEMIGLLLEHGAVRGEEINNHR